jgi:hypothetical protein
VSSHVDTHTDTYEAEEHQELVMLKEIAECCESDWIGMIPPGFFITK